MDNQFVRDKINKLEQKVE